MTRSFYSNFGFENELRQTSPSAGATVVRQNSELTHVWIALACETDWIVVPPDSEDGYCDALANAGLPIPRLVESLRDVRGHPDFVPWGWSEAAVQVAEAAGFQPRHPPLDVVRDLNSRRFSVGLESKWNCGLTGTEVIHSVDGFVAAIHANPRPDSRWIAKAEFGMAGRERVMGQGRTPQDSSVNWVAKRLREGQGVVFEPCVSLTAEAGIQLEVPRTGEPTLLGVTPLYTDGSGGFRGSRFDDDPSIAEEWSCAVEFALRAAEQMQSRGYFGPVGIDAAKYRDSDGTVKLRPFQDINARFTMGRLALGFRRLLPAGHSGVWLHRRWATDDLEAPRGAFEEFVARVPEGVQILRTSPFVVDGQPVGHGTFVVMGESPMRLTDVAELK